MSNPSMQIVDPADQPFDGKTLLVFTIRNAPARFELRAQRGGGAEEKLPDSEFERLDGNGNPAPFPFEAAGQWSGAADETFSLLWNHEVHYGQREVRNVSVRIVFGHSDKGDGDLQAPLLVNRQSAATAIGRQNGTLSDLTVARVDADSPFQVRGTYTDFADDVDQIEWTINYSFGNGGADMTDAAPAPGQPSLTLRDRQGGYPPGEPLVFDVVYDFDPFDSGLPTRIPRRAYSEFRIDVAGTERFGGGSRFPGGNLAPAARRAGVNQAAIGQAPSIVSARVPDPGQGGSQADPGRPWFRLPVTLIVKNESRFPVRLRFSGDFAIDNNSQRSPVTLISEPGAETEIDLAPGEQRVHYLVWNVVKDVGLGFDPAIEAHTVQANIVASVVDDFRFGRAVSGAAPTNVATLITNPFVRFKTQLADDVNKMRSAASNRFNKTRQLFFSRIPSGSSQGYLLLADQQFEPLAIQGLEPADFRGLPNTNGISNIFPVEVGDRPNCVVQRGGGLDFVTWERLAGKRDGEPTIKAASIAVRGNRHDDAKLPALPFRFGDTDMVLLWTFDSFVKAPTGEFDSAVYPLVASVDKAAMQVVEREEIQIARKVDAGFQRQLETIRAVDVDRSNNPTQKRVVLASAGSSTQVRGADGSWLDLVTMTSTDSGRTVQIGTERLPALPDLPTGYVPADLSEFRVTTVPVASQPDWPTLLVVRELEAKNGSRRARLLYFLRQQSGGGFNGSTWVTERVPDLTDRRQYGLGAVFAKDLDDDGDGDVLLTYKRRGDQRQNLVELRVVGRQPSTQWRTLFIELEPDSTGPTQRIGDWDLVDVNGDQALDLVAGEFDNSDPKQKRFIYFSSARTGVAGGLGRVPENAGSRPCARPATLELNGDGLPDVVSQGVMLAARPNGEFDLLAGNLAGTLSANYEVEQVFAPGEVRADEVDVLSFTVGSTDVRRNQVHVLSGVGSPGTPVVTRRHEIDSGTRPIHRVLPFQPPGGVGADLVKPLAAILAVQGKFRAFRVNATSNQADARFVAEASALGADNLMSDQLATVRLGAIPSGARNARNALTQDLFAVQEDAALLVRFVAARGYASETLVVPNADATERVVSIDAAPATADRLEDLVITTVRAGSSTGSSIYRVRVLQQQPNGEFGAGPLLMQFGVDNTLTGVFRGVGFDADAPGFASGALLMQSEARVILPGIDPQTQQFAARMVRSPLSDGGTTPLSLVVDDNDRDGLIEVLASSASSTKLLKLDSGFRR